LAFHPKGRFAYVINELASTMTAFAYDSKGGTLTDIQTLSTLPEGFTNQNSTAEVEAHPSGTFLYGSNRGHDSIVVYAVDQESGKLTLIEHQPTRGRTPRHFAIDPTGQWLLAANQGTDSVVVFRMDPQTGRLTPNDETVSVGGPVCLKFVPLK
jgi:6-phosphogluconolactonase